jgi:hypothetical protein
MADKHTPATNSTNTNTSSSPAATPLAGKLRASKYGKLNKLGNIIHRTTSESLRLGGNNTNSHLSSLSSLGGGGGSSSLSLSSLAGVSTPTSVISMSTSSSSSSPLAGPTGGPDKSHLTLSSAHHTTGGGGGNNNNSPSAQGGGGGGKQQPKSSSFQITSVKVGPRMSADNGDESADDLDESHTDENSRHTDLENDTPSFSEETSFSKEDVFFATTNAIGSAPVIPTSSQYGLAIVAPELGGTGPNFSDVHVSVTDAGINIMQAPGKQDVDLKEINQRNERFKVSRELQNCVKSLLWFGLWLVVSSSFLLSFLQVFV